MLLGRLRRHLKIPVMAAPMFLVSGPDLVVEACQVGVLGTFPVLNQRTPKVSKRGLPTFAAGSPGKIARLSILNSSCMTPIRGTRLTSPRHRDRPHQAEIISHPIVEMTPDRIVEALDVIERICSGLVSGAICFPRNALGLRRGEETLHRRAAPDIARSAHTADDAAVCNQLLELFAGMLASLIRAMQQRGRLAVRAHPAIDPQKVSIAFHSDFSTSSSTNGRRKQIQY